MSQKLSACGKGEVEVLGVEDWTSVGERLTAEKTLAADAKKDLAADITSNLRKLLDDINEDNWMYDPINVAFNTTGKGR